MDSKKFGDLILEFYEKQQKFKKIQSQFLELKKDFNNKAEAYFKRKNINKYQGSLYDKTLTVNRIQKTNITFDCEKLKKVLGKELSKQVIQKKYEVVDMESLISYLKECNVDSKIFRSFLNISQQVDTKELDKLEELGKISKEQLEGCYTLNFQNPYFTVNMKRESDEEIN